jgi:hypothetical protein
MSGRQQDRSAIEHRRPWQLGSELEEFLSRSPALLHYWPQNLFEIGRKLNSSHIECILEMRVIGKRGQSLAIRPFIKVIKYQSWYLTIESCSLLQFTESKREPLSRFILACLPGLDDNQHCLEQETAVVLQPYRDLGHEDKLQCACQQNRS